MIYFAHSHVDNIFWKGTELIVVFVSCPEFVMTGSDRLPVGIFFCLCFSKNLLHQSCHSGQSASDSWHIAILVFNIFNGGVMLFVCFLTSLEDMQKQHRRLGWSASVTVIVQQQICYYTNLCQTRQTNEINNQEKATKLLNFLVLFFKGVFCVWLFLCFSRAHCSVLLGWRRLRACFFLCVCVCAVQMWALLLRRETNKILNSMHFIVLFILSYPLQHYYDHSHITTR